MINENIRSEIGTARYEKAADNLDKQEKESFVERYIGGKKTHFRKSVAERLDMKGKTEKPKTYFFMKK